MIKTSQKSNDKIEVLRKVVNFLSYRLRSEQEVFARLKLYTNDQAVVNYVMDYLHAYELLDDVKFAARWVTSRQSTHSSRTLRQELQQKGIGQEIINRSLPKSDRQALLTFIQKKGGVDKQKLFRYLLGKGFSSDLIREVLN